MTVPSPCRSICRIGSDGQCDGCGRSLGEIAAWLELAPAERDEVMRRVRDWAPREPGDIHRSPAGGPDSTPAAGRDLGRGS